MLLTSIGPAAPAQGPKLARLFAWSTRGGGPLCVRDCASLCGGVTEDKALRVHVVGSILETKTSLYAMQYTDTLAPEVSLLDFGVTSKDPSTYGRAGRERYQCCETVADIAMTSATLSGEDGQRRTVPNSDVEDDFSPVPMRIEGLWDACTHALRVAALFVGREREYTCEAEPAVVALAVPSAPKPEPPASFVISPTSSRSAEVAAPLPRRRHPSRYRPAETQRERVHSETGDAVLSELAGEDVVARAVDPWWKHVLVPGAGYDPAQELLRALREAKLKVLDVRRTQAELAGLTTIASDFPRADFTVGIGGASVASLLPNFSRSDTPSEFEVSVKFDRFVIRGGVSRGSPRIDEEWDAQAFRQDEHPTATVKTIDRDWLAAPAAQATCTVLPPFRSAKIRLVRPLGRETCGDAKICGQNTACGSTGEGSCRRIQLLRGRLRDELHPQQFSRRNLGGTADSDNMEVQTDPYRRRFVRPLQLRTRTKMLHLRRAILRDRREMPEICRENAGSFDFWARLRRVQLRGRRLWN